MSRKLFRYFASDKGRKFVFYGTLTLGVSTFSALYLPQAFFVEKYREIIASYQNGFERKVSEPLLNKFEKACNLVKLTDPERALLKPFVVAGFDLYSIGSTTFKYGGLVGIPLNFTYSAADEIPRADIKLKGYEDVDWQSEGGKLLEQGLIFTEDEQVFGIAREMLELKTSRVLFNSLLGSGSIFMYYSITNGINHSQRLFARPLSLRLVLYTLAGLFTSGVYCMMKDWNQNVIDSEIDEKLSQCGERYVKAGVGFYDKVLKKNMAIRHLTGSSQFTATGNLNTYFRTPSLPINVRKLNFENYLKNLNASQEQVK